MQGFNDVHRDSFHNFTLPCHPNILYGVNTKVSLDGIGGKVLDRMIHCRSSAALKKGRQAVEIWNDNGVFRPDEHSSGIDTYFMLLTAQFVVGLRRV